MGQASRAPGLKNTKMVEVTNHAMEKLRERLTKGSHLNSMPDSDLKLRLEEIWQTAVRLDLVETWYEKNDHGEIDQNLVVNMQDGLETDLIGLFRTGRRDQPVLVTVLTAAMVHLKQATNVWAKDPEKIGDKGLHVAQMKDQLTPLLSTLPKRAAARPIAAIAPAPLPTPPEPEIMDLILVTWIDNEGDACSRRVDKSAVSDLVARIMQEGDEKTIEFWTKKEAKIKKKIDVEF